MAGEFRKLLESAPNRLSPGIVVRDNESNKALNPGEINELTVMDLGDYGVSVLGAPLEARESPRGYFGFYDGSAKVTDFIHPDERAHIFLKQAYDTVSRQRASC